ncbi:Cytochrome c oxidase-assembly factor cox-23, mitochondrial [Golovinomyces cichoracearum]|uniref:Cytochrome c oxidase-assembly factor cox-23, mitochondrial n=1 Tax=Golovinomyces cichoracearum TaxID=62708 RepID=A0A420J6M1_9PEZI|nr:Cytochrome c oxidase-assembly factor cox-23, mitochondrial [Golovinomyces cichoracearum]
MSSTKPEGIVWDSELKAQYESKRPGEYMDPCQDAASKSMKCLHRNGGDKEMCTDYFQTYRDCKKQWLIEMKELKRKEAKPWFKFS